MVQPPWSGGGRGKHGPGLRDTPVSVVGAGRLGRKIADGAFRQGDCSEELQSILPCRQGRRTVLRALDGADRARSGGRRTTLLRPAARRSFGFADPAVAAAEAARGEGVVIRRRSA